MAKYERINYSNPKEVKARLAEMTETTQRLIARSDEVGRESERLAEELKKYFARKQ